MPFPVEAARYSNLRAAKDGVLWLRHPVRGVLGASRATPDDPDPKTDLERYDLAQQRIEHLAVDADHFEVSGDGKRVLLWTDGRLKVVPSDRRASSDDDSDSNITVDLARVRQFVDPSAEWRQMFDENGRIMRDNFWRPDMSGVDWDGVLDRYRPVLDRLATHDDLVDLLWEVHGELGTSHAYVTPAAASAAPGRDSSARTSPGTRTAAGGWTASCPPRPPTRRPAPRSPRPASRSGPATRSSPSPDSPSTRSPAPRRCWWGRRASPSS